MTTQHALALVQRGDPLHCRDDPVGELLARLTVVSDLAVLPPGKALGEPLLDLGSRQPRPRADVDLAERRVEHDGEA